MTKALAIFVLFILMAWLVGAGIAIALDTDAATTFLIGLVCGLPAGFGAVFIAIERDWL